LARSTAAGRAGTRLAAGIVCFACAASWVLAAEVPPLSLGEALSDALRDNPRIRDACDALSGARYGRDIANADFAVQLTPQATSGLGTDTETSQSSVVSLNKKFSYGTIVELAAGTTSSQNDFHRSFSGVTVSQGLFQSFGKQANTGALADAEHRIGGAERQLRLVEEQVVVDVVDGFYRVVGLESLVKILDGALERARRHSRAAEARLARAVATRMDIFRTQAQTAGAEGALLEARESLLGARDGLRLLLGKDLEEPLEVEPGALSVVVNESEDQLLKAALGQRVEVADAAAEVADAERQVALADHGRYPDLRVGVNFSLVGFGSSFRQSTSFDDSGFRFLVGGTNPLDRSAESARAGQARIELQRRKREHADVRERVAMEVREAVRHLATVEQRIEVGERNVEATRANVELATLRFDRGYADTLEVLQAEETLSQAEREEVALRIERVLASLRVRRAAGLLGDFLETTIADGAKHASCA
jgi:outer membrane protein TolC